jgi:thiopurine S-methyltransferase
VEADFWLNRWRNAQIGFHQPAPDKRLTAYWAKLELARGSRIFVPLCGKSLDLLWLKDKGHDVVGVELSPIALESFCMENGIPARRRLLEQFEVYEADQLALIRGDFFNVTPSLLGNVAAVFDRAALISWPPTLRPAYARHLASLMPSGSRMLLVAVEFPEHEMSGPPYPVTRGNIDELLGSHYVIELLGHHEILDLEPRLRARGLTQLSEIVYRLTRL